MSRNVINEIMDSWYTTEKNEGVDVALIRMNPKFFHELASLDGFQAYLSTDVANGYNKFNGIPVEITPKVNRYTFLNKYELSKRSEKKTIFYKISTMDILKTESGDVEYKFSKRYGGHNDDWNGVFIQIIAEQLLSCEKHDEITLELECNGYIQNTLITGSRLRSFKDVRVVNRVIQDSLEKFKDSLENLC